MVFELYAFRFRFRAADAIHFPAGTAGNIVRGAFGTIFRRLACRPDCTDAKMCAHRFDCAYARTFEPSALAPGPSGLSDWPRPFVFRAHWLDGRTLAPGDGFHFDVHLFYPAPGVLDYFGAAFRELSGAGLGPGRGRAELTSVDPVVTPLPVQVRLEPEAASRVLVRFVAPMELKAGDRMAERPEFGVLFARARDRLSTLRALYGPGPLDIDFRAVGDRAARVRMVRCDIQHVAASRRSSRTGQTHPIGGFTGEAEYEGDAGEFVPYLRAAVWTGIGRQTVWGKGAIEVTTG